MWVLAYSKYIANYDPSLAAFGWKAAVEMARRARPNHLQYAVDKAVTWSASAEAAGYGAEAPRSAAAETAVGKVSLTGAVISIADVTDLMTEDTLHGAAVVAGNVVSLRPPENEAWPPLDAA